MPSPLVDQLAIDARLVIPVGGLRQEMMILTKTDNGVVERTTIPVLFVPMTGEALTR